MSLFSDRKFIVVKDPEEADTEIESIENDIRSHGGAIISWKDRLESDNTPQLVMVAKTVDFSHYHELKNLMVPTVTPEWIEDCIKIGKKVPMRPYSPDPRNFLSKVQVCCSGLSKGDTDAISAGVRAVGGDCSKELNRYTTHVISTDVKTDICETALTCSYDIKVVSPEWIDDCIKLQCKLNEEPYLLTNQQSNGARHDSAESDLIGTYSMDQTPRLAVQSSVRHELGSSLLDGRVFYLSSDLDLSERLLKTITFLIETNSGTITQNLTEAGVYLGKWREGDDYRYASQHKLVVGNLTWLYWLIIQKQWETPLKWLLHYPEVRGGLPDMVPITIAITNYTGDSRTYLQTLTSSLGARYTGSLIQNTTTHLIAAYAGGPKYEAAKSWGIKIVNHLWLEETYAMWQLQPETLPRYTHLPTRLDMTTLIGTTHLVPQVLRQFYSDKHEPERVPLPKRAARTKANEELHESVLKENLFQKQKRYKVLPDLPETGQVGESTPGTVENGTENLNSTPPEPVVAQEPTPEPAVQRPPVKRAKKAASPAVRNSSDDTLRIMITGMDSPPSKQKCAKTGLHLTENPPASTLVAPRILRTAKFLSSLAEVTSCVTPAWLDACFDAGQVVDTAGYEIESDSLQQALKKSAEMRAEGRGLFSGLAFRLLPEVKGGPKVVEQIVRAHKGTITKRKTENVLVGGEQSEITLDDVINCILTMDAERFRQ